MRHVPQATSVKSPGDDVIIKAQGYYDIEKYEYDYDMYSDNFEDYDPETDDLELS